MAMYFLGLCQSIGIGKYRRFLWLGISKILSILFKIKNISRILYNKKDSGELIS